ncbi:ArsR/SmtB family transcription factor [Cognatishimia activa]|uniref:ArsR/SmtB family transcription factor n=1 Tax=Cognatishimia activa TaxID=1715691 RepID=UPI00222F2581|nr:metalloregulator ArsR/SmtB family transcription factor [Cognatishimia activa]UZD91490.1 metalloregulator ArsR/SmtB family transcription factor [Cognatishimia activa]
MSFELQPTFRALADPTRRDILKLLASDDLTIAQVAEQFDMTRGAVKKHLTILEEGQLIKVTAKGRERVNQLNPTAIRPAFDWLSYFESFWTERLDALKAAVESSDPQNKDQTDD